MLFLTLILRVPNKEGGSGGPRRSLFLTIKGQQVCVSSLRATINFIQVVVLHWDVRHEELVEMEDKEQEERLVCSRLTLMLILTFV